MHPTIHSPLALLFAKIKAEMVANSTPFADAAAEVAFRAWLQTAWLDSGCTQDFAVLYQPSTSTAFSVGVLVGTAGHKVNVWWGDGNSDSYTPSTSINTTVSHTYGSAAKRPIVILGRVTVWEGSSQAYGGRLWENMRSLTYVNCNGATNVSGRVDTLPALVSKINCGDCTLVSGDMTMAPAGVIYADLWRCTVVYRTSGGRAWADRMEYVGINPPTLGVFTSAMVDALLIDLSGVATWSGAKLIYAAGSCGAPTSAADAAIDSLLSKGVTVNTN